MQSLMARFSQLLQLTTWETQNSSTGGMELFMGHMFNIPELNAVVFSEIHTDDCYVLEK